MAILTNKDINKKNGDWDNENENNSNCMNIMVMKNIRDKYKTYMIIEWFIKKIL